ncbi:MAG: hypothetical protein LBK66_13955 [Spirochaetaceae bacterium]|nr:hypothetical protein [Spirochaetaceae bacterium]
MHADVRTAETQTHDEIARILGEKNITFREQSLMPDYGAFGTSIEALLPARSGSGGGGTGANSLFVLTLPITSAGGKPASSNEKLSWGHELAFKFIDIILSEPPSFDTLIYFAGDNWPVVSPGAYPYAGLQALFNQLENREDVILMYCDFPAPPDAIQIVKGKGQTAAPLALVEPFFKICAEHDVPCFLNTIDAGLDAEFDNFAAAVYSGGDIPAWFNIPRNEEKITVGEAAIIVYEYAADITQNKIDVENTDRNYAHIGFNRKNIFISEYTLVLLILFASTAVCFLCLLLFYISKSRIKRLVISVFALVLFISLISFAILYTNTGKNIRQTPKKSQQKIENIVTEHYFTAETEEIRFLDRNIVKIKINTRHLPLHYRLFFTRRDMEDPVYFIYDAPMPYSTQGRHTEFILGSYPPASLNLEIALPRNLSGDFIIEALFEDGSKVVQSLPYNAGI